MATGTLAPFFTHQFFDDDGDPLAGGKISTYLAGTTTPTPTYTDVGLSVAHANPIILDAGGRATIYLDPAVTYKFLVKTAADVTVVTVDNVSAVPTSQPNLEQTGTAGENIAANDAVYLSDGSGGRTAGRWYRTDADTVYMSSGAVVVGMAPSAIASGATGTIRRLGVLTGLSGLTAGALYYASATAGALTATAPGAARVIGQALTTTTLALAPSAATEFVLFAGNSTDPAVSATDTARLAFHSATNELRLSVDGGAYLPVPTVDPAVCQGRLTLTSGTAITATDVTAATAVYFTPFSGNRVALYDGTRWRLFVFTERTLSLSGLAANTNYDVYLYDNAGTLTLEATAWTNATTRATALTTQDGVLVRSGATTRRYLGTVRTTGTIGQTEDSLTRRLLYNEYHAVPRVLRRLESTNSWSYGTSTLRQANASAANQVDLVVGREGVTLEVQVVATAASGNSGVYAKVAIGEDSTTAAVSGCLAQGIRQDASGAARHGLSAFYRGVVPLGYHYYAWLEAAEATYDFFGDDGGPSALSPQSGMTGAVLL